MALLTRAVFVAMLLSVVVCRGLVAPAEAAPAKEYEIKAAILLNFSQFVEWPQQDLPAAGSPFVIGILGNDPFGSFLDDIVKGEQAHGRPLIVRRFRRVEDIQECHVLFIGQIDPARLREALTREATRGMLTVAEYKGFTEMGGIIQFINKNNRVRFRINLDAAKVANLKVSSQLLRVAEIMGAEKK